MDITGLVVQKWHTTQFVNRRNDNMGKLNKALFSSKDQTWETPIDFFQ